MRTTLKTNFVNIDEAIASIDKLHSDYRAQHKKALNVELYYVLHFRPQTEVTTHEITALHTNQPDQLKELNWLIENI